MSESAAEERLRLARINVSIMAKDVEEAMLKLEDEGKPWVFQSGVLIGLTCAKFVTSGCTADEAWERITPVITKMRGTEGDDT